MGIVTQCDSIFRSTVPAGNNDIVVNAGLTATTSFVYVLTDKFGNKYSKAFTTDGSGSFTISSSDLPQGLFSAYSGSFLLQVKKTLHDATPQPLKFCTVIYDTIQIDFANYPENNSPGSIIDCA